MLQVICLPLLLTMPVALKCLLEILKHFNQMVTSMVVIIIKLKGFLPMAMTSAILCQNIILGAGRVQLCQNSQTWHHLSIIIIRLEILIEVLYRYDITVLQDDQFAALKEKLRVQLSLK